MMKTIYLIRHAESTANIGGISQPNAEIPLTEKGQAQAQELAVKLDLQPTKVVVSSYIRTLQTAQPWLDKIGFTAETDPLIREFNLFGYDLVKGMTGKQRLPLALRYWRESDLQTRCGDEGETFAEFSARVETFLQTLSQREDGSVLFTHGMFIRLLMWRLLGYPMQTNEDLRIFYKFLQATKVPNAAVFQLTWHDSFQNAGLRFLPQYLLVNNL